MRKFAFIAVPFFIMTVVQGCGSTSDYRYFEGSVWHTFFHITYNSDRNLEDSIRTIFRMVELSLSPFNDSSVISKINRNESMMTDSLLRRVFKTSVAINNLSGGNFDPTVAPLVNLWGFGYAEAVTPPADSVVEAVIASVGIQDCFIDEDNLMVKKLPATEFNFSAITKGFGCDLIAEMFKRNGVTDYLIEIGGEIAMNGCNDLGKPWAIQIDAPIADDSLTVSIPYVVIEPGQCGLATSGNYRNFHRLDSCSTTIGHTISPATGYPVSTPIASATVIAADCMIADALATACMALPVNSALAMIESVSGASVLLILWNENEISAVVSKDFPAGK